MGDRVTEIIGLGQRRAALQPEDQVQILAVFVRLNACLWIRFSSFHWYQECPFKKNHDLDNITHKSGNSPTRFGTTFTANALPRIISSRQKISPADSSTR